MTTDSPRVKLRTYAPPLVVYAPVGVPIATLSHGDVASRAGAAEAVENENAERPPAPSRNDASVNLCQAACCAVDAEVHNLVVVMTAQPFDSAFTSMSTFCFHLAAVGYVPTELFEMRSHSSDIAMWLAARSGAVEAPDPAKYFEPLARPFGTTIAPGLAASTLLTVALWARIQVADV